MTKFEEKRTERLLRSLLDVAALRNGEFEAFIGERYSDEFDQAAADDAIALAVAEVQADTLLRKQILRALNRLQEGDYGDCEECGREISSKRLQAIPWASLCVSCKQLEEDSTRDPDSWRPLAA